MCDVRGTAVVFCSEFVESFPVMASKFFIQHFVIYLWHYYYYYYYFTSLVTFSSSSSSIFHLLFIFVLYFLHSSLLPWYFLCSLFSSLTFLVLFPPPIKLIYFCPSFYSWLFTVFFHLPFYLSAVVLQAQKDKKAMHPITAFFRSFWICHSSNKSLPTFRTHST